MKDPVHKLDRPGAIYKISCKEHPGSYIGETERAMKQRGYEHKIIEHKDNGQKSLNKTRNKKSNK